MRLKSLSDLLKGSNKAFPPLPSPPPPPPSPCNVVPLCELPLGNNNLPDFELREGGRLWIVLFSEVTPFEDNVSKISSSTEALS